MDDTDREIAKLKHALAQLERDTYKEAAGPRGIDVLAVTKAGFRRRIAGLKQLAGADQSLTQVPSDNGEQDPDTPSWWLKMNCSCGSILLTSFTVLALRSSRCRVPTRLSTFSNKHRCRFDPDGHTHATPSVATLLGL